MAYIKLPPPSIETMLYDFADWMAQHADAKVTVKIEYHDGREATQETDHRGPTRSPRMTRAEMAAAAKHDTSCVGAFARAKP